MGLFKGALGPALMLLPGLAFAQGTPSGFTYAMRYDAAQRVTGTITPDPDGTGPLHYLAVRNTYDAAGRLTRTEKGELSEWQSEAIAPAAWSGFAVQMQVDTSYDAMRRKTLEVTSGGGVSTATQYSYNNQGLLECTAVRMNSAIYTALPASACMLGADGSDGPDRIVRNEYDAAGQLLKVQKAYGVVGLQQDYATYTYSANGKQLSVKDANGNLATMSYDGFDQQVSWTFPSQTTPGQTNASDYESYGYDQNGNRTSLRKRDGRTFTYGYDALNRMTAKIVPDGCAPVQVGACALASATRDVYYGYDSRGLQTYARFDSPLGEGVTNTYDGFGALASSTTTIGGVTRTLSNRYDLDANRTQLTYPDGTVTNFVYDGLNRLAAIRDAAGNDLTTLTYYASGGRGWMGYGANGTGYGYDPLIRLTGYKHQRNESGTVVADNTTLVYSPSSQIKQQIRSSTAYAWNGAVNVDRLYATNGLNQYTGAGANTFTYDPNGNLTAEIDQTYGYDAENRLVSAAGARNVTLAYDPLGRLWQVGAIGSTVTRFAYDGDKLIAEYDDGVTLLNRYVHASGVDEPVLWYRGSNPSPRQLFADHHGSIIGITEHGGSLTAVNTYDEYGIPGANNQGRFQYTGQAWLPELGMSYYKARIYSPTLGRFLQTDPIGYDDQVNLYAYVANDPVNGRDPTGNWTCVSNGNGTSSCTATGAIDSIAMRAYVTAYNTAAFTSIVIRNIILNNASETPTAKANPDGTVTGASGKPIPTAEGGPRAGKRFTPDSPAAKGEKAKQPCEYCGKPRSPEKGQGSSAERDHGKARSQGGSGSPDNEVPACRDCNRSKGANDMWEWVKSKFGMNQ